MPNQRRITFLVIGLGCLLVASALVFAEGLPERAAFTGVIDSGGTRYAPEVGALAPAFSAALADGSTFELAATRERVVVLNYWATWCGPCRIEMPELEALQQAYGERALVVVGINTGEALEDVLDWRDNYALSFPLALDPTGEVSGLYAIRGQPQTFVIAPDGEIVQIYFGPVTRTTLESVILPYLETAFVPLHTQESNA